MAFFTALQFLTIIPLPAMLRGRSKDTGESLPYFPLIGLLMGALLLLLHYVLSFILPQAVVFALIMIALVILGGAHHVDGLMDTFDGMVAGKTLQRRLEIMSDNKVGAFGITALVLLFLLKYFALYSNPAVVPTLLLMPVLSRWIMVSAIYTFPYARTAGMGLSFKHGATWPRFVVASIITVAICATFLSWPGIVLMATVWCLSMPVLCLFRSRFGGLTGDNYGAINEISEVLTALLMIIIIQFLGQYMP